MVSYEDRVDIFKDELNLILDDTVREFTKLCLSEAPDYFFTDCPASTSGKYHPISELGPDGTMLHTKKVVTVAYILCRGLDCEDKRDEIISACIIHDLVKQGVKKTGHTVKNHPKLGADLVESVQEATQLLNEESYEIIRRGVGYHYGPWSIGDWKKDIRDYNMTELCVYLSDYFASKREFHVDHRR